MTETTNNGAPMLEVKELSIQFGGLRAVDGLNLSVKKHQLYGLIGPNGAGKTTVFNMLTGVYKPTAGSVFLDGVNIIGKPPAEINKIGIARTFQNIRLFKGMSVLNNVKVGMQNSTKYTTIEGILRLPRYFKERPLAKSALRQTAQARNSESSRDGTEAPSAGRARGGHEPQRDCGAYEHYPLRA